VSEATRLQNFDLTSSAAKAPLRIALLGYRSNPYSGGQGIYLKYVSRALRALGHEVHVISGEPYPDLDDGIRLIKLPGLNLYAVPSPLRAWRWRFLTSITDLFEWLSILSGGFPEPYTFGRRVAVYLWQHRHEYDVIHDNQSLSYGVLKLQKQGLPVVSTIHHPITYDREIALAHNDHWGMRLLIKRWHHFLAMQTKVARRLKHIQTVSRQSKIDICNAFSVNPENICVVHNGVDTDEFRPLPDIHRDQFHLITTASADQPLKGTQHLIPAFAKLRQEFPHVRLTFIGQPKAGGDTQKLIDQLGVGDAITFKHGISTQQIVELYARATLAVVPSEYEGFGLPAAEAMACAVPVVSTDGGALPEVVGDAGIIVPKANPQALTDAIASLLRDPVRRRTLGAAGRERMQSQFSWDTVAEELTRYYRQIVSA
jgi:glycosyltransferase involved in cell wall biosynthesis